MGLLNFIWIEINFLTIKREHYNIKEFRWWNIGNCHRVWWLVIEHCPRSAWWHVLLVGLQSNSYGNVPSSIQLSIHPQQNTITANLYNGNKEKIKKLRKCQLRDHLEILSVNGGWVERIDRCVEMNGWIARWRQIKN